MGQGCWRAASVGTVGKEGSQVPSSGQPEGSEPSGAWPGAAPAGGLAGTAGFVRRLPLTAPHRSRRSEKCAGDGAGPRSVLGRPICSGPSGPERGAREAPGTGSAQRPQEWRESRAAPHSLGSPSGGGEGHLWGAWGPPWAWLEPRVRTWWGVTDDGLCGVGGCWSTGPSFLS